MKKVKIITKLVIVIIFSLLLIDTSWAGIIPTTERNEIIPASNSEEWKSPSDWDGLPEFEKQRYKKEVEGYRNLMKHYEDLSDEEIYEKFVKAGGGYFGNTVEEARKYLLNYFGRQIKKVETKASAHAAIWKKVTELRDQGYQTMVTEYGIEAYKEGKLVKVFPLPSSESEMRIKSLPVERKNVFANKREEARKKLQFSNSEEWKTPDTTSIPIDAESAKQAKSIIAKMLGIGINYITIVDYEDEGVIEKGNYETITGGVLTLKTSEGEVFKLKAVKWHNNWAFSLIGDEQLISESKTWLANQLGLDKSELKYIGTEPMITLGLNRIFGEITFETSDGTKYKVAGIKSISGRNERWSNFEITEIVLPSEHSENNNPFSYSNKKYDHSTEEKLLNDLKSRYDYQELLALFNSMKAYLSSEFGAYINDVQLVDVEIGDRVWNSQYLTATFKTSDGTTFIVQGEKDIGYRYSHWMMMCHGNKVSVEKITPVEGVPEMTDIISSKDDWTLSMECYVKDARLFLSEQLGIDTDDIDLVEYKIGRPKDWYGSARLSVWTFKTKNGEIYTVTQIKSCLGDWSDFKIVEKQQKM